MTATSQSGLLGHVLETPPAQVPVQAIEVHGGCPLDARRLARTDHQRSTIDKEKVQETVVVEVEQRDAAPHRLDQKLLIRWVGMMPESDTRRGPDVSEDGELIAAVQARRQADQHCTGLREHD
jgi:hypothetical protein